MTDDVVTGAVAGPGGDLGVFGRYLTVWVGVAIVVGVGLGQLLPAFPQTLARFEYASVSLPVAVLIWLMIFPMMLQVDFSAIGSVRREPLGLIVTSGVNWLVKPFSMFVIAWFFLLVVFAPIVMLLLGVSDIVVPWDTILLSVGLYIVVPLGAGYVVRRALVAQRGAVWFDEVFLRRLAPVPPAALIATLVVLFAFQGDAILDNPVHIALIAVPLVVQTVFIFFLAYRAFARLGVRHDVAAPGALIGASNFFELAVATAIALFGLQSGAALAAVVGVLIEVPLMLALVRYANATRSRFPAVAG